MQQDTKQNSKSFWNNAVVYQIYPWTFAEDDERDPQLGNGSIRGIVERLPYIATLGADVIWLSPFYPSPMVDGGYDVSDWRDVHPDLGSSKDFDELVQSAHEHSIRVMVDFIPNHTSNQHEWFQKSRRKEPGFEDWYIWHPGVKDDDGKLQPPNNWASVFSIPQREARRRGEMDWLRPEEWTPPKSAWQWDDTREEFYLHSFAVEQPDLNWSNPYVREAMKDVMRFWINRGVDGFRIDAVNHIGKNMDLPDEEVNTSYSEEWAENPYDQLMHYESCGHPEELHQYIWEMCQVLQDDDFDERDLRIVFEAYMGESELRDIDAIAPDVASTFNFGGLLASWDVNSRKIQMDYYYERLPKRAIANQVNGNHDRTRLASRLGESGAKAAAILNLFLPGMRIIYNGEELGLTDAADIPEGRLQDLNGLRDAGRTPIPWNDALPNAGFSRAPADKLWLPVDFAALPKAVNRQERQDNSSLALYRHAIRLCRDLPVLQHGYYIPMRTENDQVLAYGRGERSDDEDVVVMVNFARDKQMAVRVPESSFVIGEVLLSSVRTQRARSTVDLRAGVTLEAEEALVIRRK